MTTVNESNYIPYNSNSSNEISNNSQTLMKDDFLKLFIAQLKNQDPLSPVDDSQFLAQLAQFSSLEQMSNVAKSVEELNQNMTQLTSQSLLVQGAAMIGKEAVGIGEDGQQVSGVISSVKWDGALLQVAIGENLINLENIIEVKEASSSPIPDEGTEQSGETEETEETGEIVETEETEETEETGESEETADESGSIENTQDSTSNDGSAESP